MRYKFLFFISLLFIIGNVSAQWHYTLTTQSFYGGCNNISATIHVTVYEQEALNAAAKTYNSQEECEQIRREWGTINYSNSGCYARVASTPCQGNVGEGSFGLNNGEPSLYNSIGSDGFTFSPTERDINQNTYEELMMRMEALGYNSNNATSYNPNKLSAHTGDDEYDDAIMRQSNEYYKENKSDINYNYRPNREIYPKIDQQVTLEDYRANNNGPVVIVDPERLRLQELDERCERVQKRLDSLMNYRNKAKLPKLSKEGDNLFNKVGKAAFDVSIASFNVTKVGVEELNTINNILDMYNLSPIGGDNVDKLKAFTDGVSDGVAISTKRLIGDIPGATEKIADRAIDKFFSPTMNYVQEAVSGVTSAFNTVKRALTVGDFVKETYVGTWNKTKKIINDAQNGANPNYLFKEAQKQQIEVSKKTRSTIFKFI